MLQARKVERLPHGGTANQAAEAAGQPLPLHSLFLYNQAFECNKISHFNPSVATGRS